MLPPSGPMQKGTTYMVRPFMQPSKSPFRVSFISPGAIQLLVGPASSSFSEQMNVRSSTRATSVGSDAAWKLFGRLAGSRRVSVPCSTRRPVSRSHSSSEPSHHSTRSGLVSSAIPRTHSISSVWPVGAWSRPGTWMDTGYSFSCSQDLCMMNKTRRFCHLVWTNHVRFCGAMPAL